MGGYWTVLETPLPKARNNLGDVSVAIQQLIVQGVKLAVGRRRLHFHRLALLGLELLHKFYAISS